MDADLLRVFLRKLPHVVETMQWGANLVFWVGDKAIGGKMFALVNLEEDGRGVISYAAGPERYAELLETEGVLPAPYFARIHWVCVERWQVFPTTRWQEELRSAHALTLPKLTKKTRGILELPAAQRRRLIAEQREKLRQAR